MSRGFVIRFAFSTCCFPPFSLRPFSSRTPHLKGNWSYRLPFELMLMLMLFSWLLVEPHVFDILGLLEMLKLWKGGHPLTPDEHNRQEKYYKRSLMSSQWLVSIFPRKSRSWHTGHITWRGLKMADLCPIFLLPFSTAMSGYCMWRYTRSISRPDGAFQDRWTQSWHELSFHGSVWYFTLFTSQSDRVKVGDVGCVALFFLSSSF